MNIATNPWSFVNADVPAAATAAASPGGMVQGGPGSLAAITFTSTVAHGFVVGQWLTYIADTNARFLGWYKVIAVPSVTTALLANLSSPTSGQPFNTVLAGSGGGTMMVNQVQHNFRGEDISVLATAAAPGATTLSLLDRNGLPTWVFIGVATDPGFAAQNRGKIMWVDGLTLQSIPTGVEVFITIN